MPSFRHGFRPFDGQVDTIGARKGSILYLNDGTGKFYRSECNNAWPHTL